MTTNASNKPDHQSRYKNECLKDVILGFEPEYVKRPHDKHRHCPKRKERRKGIGHPIKSHSEPYQRKILPARVLDTQPKPEALVIK
jgi:hypothetical protein